MNGTQAIARIFLDQAERDRAAGLRTAGFISGYRGSPLGGVDSTLWSIRTRLSAAKVKFQPGVNEELAATAVRGTQQAPLLPGPVYEGVFAAWYGKGPGVDRALDALKHGNFAGASAHGGVLCIYGDDHAGKSSTVAHQSEQALASALIPSLYPANAEELRHFGLLGIAMPRSRLLSFQGRVMVAASPVVMARAPVLTGLSLRSSSAILSARARMAACCGSMAMTMPANRPP